MENKEKDALSLARNFALSSFAVPTRELDRDNKRQPKYIKTEQLV